MKSPLLTALVLGFLSSGALADDYTATIKKQAQACADAMIAKNFEAMADTTHPRVLEAMGGREQMLTTVKAAVAKIEEQGFKITSSEIGTPEDVKKIGAMTVSIVPDRIVIKVPGGKLTSESHLLGISEDEGKTFKFIDIGPIKKEQLEQIFPEFAGQLTLPERKQPVMEKDP
ncbi:MAG: hypothetical protein JWO82_18 [Akkermansiaceae bacterium]|nr:hypothetical protein [Akkermansiaceae bacterium]